MRKRNQRAAEIAHESDSDSTKWLDSQKKMQDLRNNRQKQFEKVVKESHKELQNLVSQLEEKREKQRKESVKEQANHITALIDSMKRRKKIEKEMQEIVMGVQERVEEVEQMMLVGYDGRLEAMNKVFEKDMRAVERRD